MILQVEGSIGTSFINFFQQVPRWDHGAKILLWWPSKDGAEFQKSMLCSEEAWEIHLFTRTGSGLRSAFSLEGNRTVLTTTRQQRKRRIVHGE